jgi:VanZ family protein
MSRRYSVKARDVGRPLFAWVPVIVWAGLIFVFSATPDLRFLPDDSLDFVLRKIGHMGVFGILGLLLWHALARTTDRHHAWAWALASTVAYAVTDELHQSVVAGRNPSAMDVVIDGIGAVVAISTVWLIRARRSSHNE